MKTLRVAFTGLALLGLFGTHAGAESTDKPITVIELFTSQGCYSCPPAEAYLGELAGKKDIVALEYHVDYWDRLNYGRHGRWKDAFSTPEMTQRQRSYNLAIRNTGNVYTPQMVIDGREEAVGSRRREVRNLVKAVRKDDQPRVSVQVAEDQDGGIAISLPGELQDGADVWLVTFIRERTTEVVRGENHGKTLVSHNIVRRVQHVGAWNGSTAKFNLSKSDLKLEPGQGCAILVQNDRPGPVLGAAYCPTSVDPASS
ncbi:MAG: DUF1223 domain-containing protein [Alphaproteobacteria bacterium]|nr:DUF1223 domain-containing protein [Alphaproteobacteria bacterium]